MELSYLDWILFYMAVGLLIAIIGMIYKFYFFYVEVYVENHAKDHEKEMRNVLKDTPIIFVLFLFLWPFVIGVFIYIGIVEGFKWLYEYIAKIFSKSGTRLLNFLTKSLSSKMKTHHKKVSPEDYI